MQPFRGERDGKPEKGTSQQIERVGADEVGPQIGQMVPAPAPRADGVMGQAVKRHLLYIEIPVKQEPPAIHQDERQEYKKGKPQAQGKGF